MNTEWERINQLFHQALECTDEERAELIARAAQNDPTLLGEVQSLLAMHEENNSFMEIPAFRTSLSPQFGKWQEQIVDAQQTPSGKLFSRRDRMVGQLLDGKYEIEALCGRGGMGAVYRATHVGTGRRVAVKVIAPELAGNSEFIERFRQEAKTIGSLHHPNIVNVTDFGITAMGADTVAYLVMEYLEGNTLAERLKNRRPMPLNEVIAVLSQTCAGMDEAHRLGILHRDLKPENIWLEPVEPKGCNVKVLDFGIARLQDLHAFDVIESEPVSGEAAVRYQPLSITEEETLRLNYTVQQLSRFGSVMGTPKYMSPEQCRGERVDQTSDVYSLGVIAYQMLAGDPPFIGTMSEVLMQHCEADPMPLREKRWMIPPHVDAVVNQALAKDKNARPQTAGAFAFLLHLHSQGNEWIRREADALFRKRRWKFIEIAVRMQWRGWLLSMLLLLSTLKLPGMSTLLSVAVFGALWLIIIAITLWGHTATTAACTLFLVETEEEKNAEVDVRNIARTVRHRFRDLAKAAFVEILHPFRALPLLKLAEIRQWWGKLFDQALIIPAVIHQGVTVNNASLRSPQLMAPIRQKTAYPLLRRLLAFALGLTALQAILLAMTYTYNRGFFDVRFFITLSYRWVRPYDFIVLKEMLKPWLPVILVTTGILGVSIVLKSAIEQALLYLTARRALGEIPVEQSTLSLRPEQSMRLAWWSKWKTYAPTCAFIAMMIGFHLGKFPLMKERVVNGDLYSVKALQAAGVPVPHWSYRSKPRIWAVFRSPAMTKYLIEKGANVNAPVIVDGPWGPPGQVVVATPIMAALSSCTIDSINPTELLIQHGANVHAQDSIGRTPMTIAITNCPRAIGLLLASGANINEQTRFGSPLLTAARYKWFYPEKSRWAGDIYEGENATRILLKKGADPNLRDSEGRNALMVMSMERRRDKAVELTGEALLNAGCEINAADNKGLTPLIYAVKFERPAAVALLLRRGADVNAKDQNGESAWDWAKKSGNQEILKLLATPTEVRLVPLVLTGRGKIGHAKILASPLSDSASDQKISR